MDGGYFVAFRQKYLCNNVRSWKTYGFGIMTRASLRVIRQEENCGAEGTHTESQWLREQKASAAHKDILCPSVVFLFFSVFYKRMLSKTVIIFILNIDEIINHHFWCQHELKKSEEMNHLSKVDRHAFVWKWYSDKSSLGFLRRWKCQVRLLWLKCLTC